MIEKGAVCMGTETTQIIDLNAAEGKAVQEGEKGWNLLGKLYDGALKGIPGSKSVEALAQEYLSNCGGKKEQAAEQLIRMQVTKCTTTGFLTGLGGLITLPATITADIGSSMYVQIRMIAAIAVMGGYSLQDDVVKSMVFATLLKVEVGNLLKQVGVKTANRASLQLLKKLPGTVLTKINQKLGFRFLTKFGQKGVINLVKVVPVAGGVVNGGLNLVETKAIGKRAMKVFFA